MNRYLQTGDESLCCGCRACEQACPTGAITVRPNDEGFLYPVVEKSLCVDCGACGGVCPVEHRPEGQKPRAAYAVQHLDERVLRESSSGGAFRLLADHVIGEGGCVVGCKWDEHNRPVLAIAEKTEQLPAMQGSKYLSSDTGSIYSQVKKRLREGQTVLFTGAPCQCAGLLRFLKKPWENLITVDFLCHGMPSRQIFDAYLQTIEKRLGAKVYDIRFRDKEARGWGKAFTYRYRRNGKEKKVTIPGGTDPYSYGFFQNMFSRFSCYDCVFRGGDRFTDLTFCDYWGVERHHPQLPKSAGVSAVTVNSAKGAALCAAVSGGARWIETEAERVAEENPSLLRRTRSQIPALRGRIYTVVRQEGWDAAAKKYLRPRHLLIKKLWYRLPPELTRQIKRLLK